MGQKVLLWYGERSIDWKDFSYASLHLQTYNLAKLLMDTTTRIPSSGFQPCTSLAIWRNARIAGGSDFRVLQSLLMASTNFKSKFPRDKVYALLGIASDDQAIVPDYERTEQQVYIDSMKTMLLKGKGLLILSAAGIGFPRSLPDLPSWVPD